MKKLIILSAMFLTACVSVPVERKFPSVPDQLMVSCPPLKTIDPSATQLSVVVDNVVTNYGLYQECDNKMDTWIEWYRTQKQIFDSVK